MDLEDMKKAFRKKEPGDSVTVAQPILPVDATVEHDKVKDAVTPEDVPVDWITPSNTTNHPV